MKTNTLLGSSRNSDNIKKTRHHYLLPIWEAKYHYWSHSTCWGEPCAGQLQEKLRTKIWSRKDKIAEWELKNFPVEVGSRRITNNNLHTCFKVFDLINKGTRKALDYVARTALRATYTLWLARNTQQFGSWKLANRPHPTHPPNSRWVFAPIGSGPCYQPDHVPCLHSSECSYSARPSQWAPL